MNVVATSMPGVLAVTLQGSGDARGSFVKTFHRDELAKHGVRFELGESYYTTSHRNVIRGLHFQLPPHDHEKIVYCTAGSVQDVVVDLRRGSPAFGRHAAFTLREMEMLVIPRGCAHGFLALSDGATLTYLVSSVHAPAHDAGIRYDSAGIPWQLPQGAEPILSARDRALPALADFDSPFVFTGVWTGA